jgi:uroporphyrinogen-III synthase
MTQAGYPVEHWPLIDIVAPQQCETLAHACAHWSRWRAVFFVSPQAVLYFFKHAGNTLELRQTRYWATGAGTRQALLKHGVDQHLIDTPDLRSGVWDSEHLWLEVKDQIRSQDAVLIVRGGEVSLRATGAGSLDPAPHSRDVDQEDHQEDHQGDKFEGVDTGVGREYLAEQIKAQGAQVSWAVAYLRGAPQWSSEQVAKASEALTDGSIWIFTSSQAVKNWQRLLGSNRGPWPHAKAMATHDRIAQALTAAGVGVVRQSRPSLPDLLGSLESMT